ncbi:SPOR domain-containing protein [Limibaculum sp. FT325]|uniref:SPOR domain-containing protein n=1 Tax=Thermohalobaculum sediminis TaxID=2939436 RepID=UPI0020C17DDF|nr:SPOR domain-containing protein [Limibaculum sediminis]MCL5777572.1 SPOR domain-containing protein [Limibaculum sediminis]
MSLSSHPMDRRVEPVLRLPDPTMADTPEPAHRAGLLAGAPWPRPCVVAAPDLEPSRRHSIRRGLIAAGTFLVAAVVPVGVFVSPAVQGQTAPPATPPGSAVAEAPADGGGAMPLEAARGDYRWRYEATRFRWNIDRHLDPAPAEGRWVRVPIASERGSVPPPQPALPPAADGPVVAAAPLSLPDEIGKAAPASMIDAPIARPPELPRVAALAPAGQGAARDAAAPPPRAEAPAGQPEEVAAPSPATPAPTGPAVAALSPEAAEVAAPEATAEPTPAAGGPATEAAPVAVPAAGDPAQGEGAERVGALTPAPATPSLSASPWPPERPAFAEPMIQVGLFGVPANAARMLARLDAGGFAARGIPVTMGGRDFTRVVAGPFADPAEFDRAMALIRESGIDDAYAVYR